LAQPTTTFLDELMAAVRGTVMLMVGNRQASACFDFSQRGLVGSFIALLLAFAVQAFGPQLLGVPTTPGIAGGAVILGLMIAGVQFGVAYLVLRQLGRADGFVPFVVVQNWVTLVQAFLVVAIIGVFGQPLMLDATGEAAQLTSGTIPFVLVGVVALVITVNIARLILTLRPLHVALFVIAQLTTAFLVQPILGAII
jgi:hypothetical protein